MFRRNYRTSSPVLALLKESGTTYNQFSTDAIDSRHTNFLHIGDCPESLQEELKQMFPNKIKFGSSFRCFEKLRSTP